MECLWENVWYTKGLYGIKFILCGRSFAGTENGWRRQQAWENLRKKKDQWPVCLTFKVWSFALNTGGDLAISAGTDINGWSIVVC